ncbi:tetratricopeptide repeat protein [Methylocella sp.]|uniref:tetratricopeptide repeat protein n=1 Tax=Methylocella sp. TaxID=1978226 RepID=UPI00378501FA
MKRLSAQCLAIGAALVLGCACALAQSMEQGRRAAAARNYVRAAEIFLPHAVAGDAAAQAYLGHMYAQGQGVPQNFVVAASWYRCAANQGLANAQYQLGLMYDKGQGVPQDYVMAYVWLNLAVAGAGPEREQWTRIRDAVSSKLTLLERQSAQLLAFSQPPAQPCLPIEVRL